MTTLKTGIDSYVRVARRVACFSFPFAFAAKLVASEFDYEADVFPVLGSHCIGCHGPEKEKGDIRFDTLSNDFVNDRIAAEVWHDASNNIKRGEMPPAKDGIKPLTRGQREVLTTWIDTQSQAAFDALRKLAGADRDAATSGSVMRRLNRYEYQYTMQDLLGFEMDYIGDLPEDARTPEGFRNNGEVLGMSGLQIEYYLKSAREAMGLILVSGDRPETVVTPVPINRKEDPGKIIRFPSKAYNRLGRTDFWLGRYDGVEIPNTGRFTIRVKAKAIDWREDWPAPLLRLQYGYWVGGAKENFLEALGELQVDSRESKVYEISGYAEHHLKPDVTVNRKSTFGVIRMTNALDDGAPLPERESKILRYTDSKGVAKERKYKDYPVDPQFPKIFIESVELVANGYPEWPPPAHRRIVSESDDISDRASRQEIVARFLRRAWRRPVAEDELERWMRHDDQLRESAGGNVEALRETLAATLASSNFLYMREPPRDGGRLNDHEIATRLSYLLWSSMPDDELFELADAGRLRDPVELAKQLRRMLVDEKSGRFVKHFTSQWLDLDGVDRVAIDPQVFKDFDKSIKGHMRDETRAFFGEILRSGESALNLLDSEFTMLNGPLAAHYGYGGQGSPRSRQFERVALADMGDAARPGGVLGQGVVHLVGSDGADSHPIKRAVWIRERLLHDPPKPPPPDVPDLSQPSADTGKLSLREQLEAHRQKAACADCHDRLDPWGIALEEYNPLGLHRSSSRKTRKKISAKTVLPGDVAIEGIESLKEHLLEHRREQFAHSLVANLMTYTLGRSMRFEDEAMLGELTEHFAEHEYRLLPLLEAIVTSDAFLSR